MVKIMNSETFNEISNWNITEGCYGPGVNLRCKNIQFEEELRQLINKHSIENVLDMPDFLIAEMLINVINSIGPISKRNLDWHGCDSVCHPKVDKK